MIFSKDNIEAFILTYNRKDMLKDSLTSLLNQSLGNILITVMDNGSTDGTENMILNMQKSYPNIRYYKQNTNIGQRGNFCTAVNLANKDYVILFHDDDILHPDYLKNTLKVINKFPDAAIISSFYKEWTHPDNNNWKKVSTNCIVCKNKKAFANYLYRMQAFCYSNTIYKTSNLKEYIPKNESLAEFGKISDKPFVLKTMKDNDKAIIFCDKNYIRYRVHPGQDTSISGPSYEEIIAYNKFFKSYMQDSPYSKFMYNLINYKQLKNGYRWRNDSTLSLNEFIKKAIEEDAGCSWTKKCIMPGVGNFFIETAHILRKIFKTKYKHIYKL